MPLKRLECPVPKLVKSDTRPRPTAQEIIVDDYREAYHWLRDKTPEDARVMAWWD